MCAGCAGPAATGEGILEDLVPLTDFGPVDGGQYEYGWQGDYLEAYLISDVGKKREKNEDSCIITAPSDPDLTDRRGVMFAVADGMGGASAGEYASRMTLNLLSHEYFASPNSTVPKAMRTALEQANASVFEESDVNPALSGMGTTCSAMVVYGDWAYIAQVGDSRVYLLRERAGIHQLTHDHSLVAEQVRSGLISEEEARTHTLKNLITRAVGIKPTVKVDLFALELQRGDTLLICSDGLSNMVSDQQISETLGIGDLRTNAHELINLALAGGGTDNITAVVLRVTDTPPKTPIQEGASEIRLTPSGLFGRIRQLFR